MEGIIFLFGLVFGWSITQRRKFDHLEYIKILQKRIKNQRVELTNLQIMLKQLTKFLK